MPQLPAARLTSEIELLFRLVAHPLRRRIWRVALNSETPISPLEISELLNERLGNVSYHVQQLAEGSAIILVRREPVRGAFKNFYEATDEFDRRRVLALIAEANGEAEPADGDGATS